MSSLIDSRVGATRPGAIYGSFWPKCTAKTSL